MALIGHLMAAAEIHLKGFIGKKSPARKISKIFLD